MILRSTARRLATGLIVTVVALGVLAATVVLRRTERRPSWPDDPWLTISSDAPLGEYSLVHPLLVWQVRAARRAEAVDMVEENACVLLDYEAAKEFIGDDDRVREVVDDDGRIREDAEHIPKYDGTLRPFLIRCLQTPRHTEIPVIEAPLRVTRTDTQLFVKYIVQNPSDLRNVGRMPIVVFLEKPPRRVYVLLVALRVR